MADKQGFTPVQAPEPAQGSAVEAPQEVSQVVNPADVNAMLTEEKVRSIVESSLSAALRKVQSDSAKQETRIKKEVERRIEEMKAVGITTTPEQEKQLENVVRQRENPQPTEETSAPPPRTDSDGENVDPVTAAGYEMMDQYGVDLEADDPESKMLDHTTPLKYLKSLEAALQKKAARVGQVRAPVGGGTASANPIRNIKDLDTLFQMSVKK